MDTSKQYKKLSDGASPLKQDYIVERVKWYEDPIYIKMCDCPEIQKGHKWELGSYYYMPKDGECAIYSSECREFSRFTTLSDGKEFALDDPFIWLPLQHQLQEVVIGDLTYSNSYSTLYNLMKPIYDYWLNWKDRHNFTSMEQLWLAFVMKEKFNKTWDGEQWT